MNIIKSQEFFRKAVTDEIPEIWEMLQDAIERRRVDGSDQWQDGYPNLEVVLTDVEEGHGFVLIENNLVVAYAAVFLNDEPAYENIEGEWLTNGDFFVVHRVVVSKNALGTGKAKELINAIENLAKENEIPSIRMDTNFDNPAMLSIIEKLGYQYCGEVAMRGSARRAFEKIITEKPTAN